MSRVRRIPATFARGGTSRGAYLMAGDLPGDPSRRDAVILAIYGSPDARQIDGLGGGDPLTSKVAVVGPSSRADADVDYSFGQVGIETDRVFWTGNCGNMSAGVGPFAIERGLVAVTEPETAVRIYNTNTHVVLTAWVQVENGEVVEEGDATIAGVPGSGAPIYLDFGDCAGTVSDRLLPTGNVQDEAVLDEGIGVRYSLVDAATPFVFVSARDVQAAGTESAAMIDADEKLLSRLEQVRTAAAVALGVVAPDQEARVVSPGIPRVVMVSEPVEYVAAGGARVRAEDSNVVARQLSMQRAHKTYSVTGTICTAVAANVPGTVVNELATDPAGDFRIGHPGGVIDARVAVDTDGQGHRITEASLVRTARTIMQGQVHVPAALWPDAS